jgi:hypothetical protein
METTVSPACRAEMHPACQDTECGCGVCHHQCGSCGGNCRVLYPSRTDADLKICADCVKLEIRVYGQQTGLCQSCGSFNRAYRDPRSGDERHLCTPCHKAAGHRYQENGRWVESTPSI